MALFKVNRGNSATLPVSMIDGYAYFCTDTCEFFIDYADENGELHRKQINANEAKKLIGYDIKTILNDSEVEIPTSKAVFDALNLKQDVITGIEGQYVGFDKHGNTVAEDTAGAEDALITLSELGIIVPAQQDGVIYTDHDGKILNI